MCFRLSIWPNEHLTFFFPDTGRGTANTAAFGWRNGSGRLLQGELVPNKISSVGTSFVTEKATRVQTKHFFELN
jgi:hypothetical protein